MNYLMDYYISWDMKIIPIRSLNVIMFDEDSDEDKVVVFKNDKNQLCEAKVRHNDGRRV